MGWAIFLQTHFVTQVILHTYEDLLEVKKIRVLHMYVCIGNKHFEVLPRQNANSLSSRHEADFLTFLELPPSQHDKGCVRMCSKRNPRRLPTYSKLRKLCAQKNPLSNCRELCETMLFNCETFLKNLSSIVSTKQTMLPLSRPAQCSRYSVHRCQNWAGRLLKKDVCRV
jgi:hypothetical protein